MQNETLEETAPKSAEQQEDCIAKIAALFNEIWDRIRALNPLKDGYAQLSVSASGFGEFAACRAHVFYGSDYAFDFSSLADLERQVAERNPEKVKADRIARLEAELAKLKGGAL